MSKLTTMEQENAHGWVYSQGGTTQLCQSWVRGDVPLDVQQTIRAAPEEFGMSKNLSAVDDHHTLSLWTQWIQAMQLLVPGKPHQSSVTMMVNNASDAEIFQRFREQLLTLLDRVGFALPDNLSATLLTELLHDLVGKAALSQFREMRDRVVQFRITGIPRSLVEEWIVQDYPELVDRDEQDDYTYALSFREYLFHRLIEWTTTHEWRLKNGQAPETLLLTWTDADMAEFVAVLERPSSSRELIDCGAEVRHEIQSDPQAQTVIGIAAGQTIVSTSALGQLAHDRKRWSDVEDKLTRYPILEAILDYAGIDQRLVTPWLSAIRKRVEAGWAQAFRVLLRDSLTEVVAARGHSTLRWPDQEQWFPLIERSVLRARLAEVRPREEDGSRWLCRIASNDDTLSLKRVKQLQPTRDQPQIKPNAYKSFHTNLLMEMEKEVQTAKEIWYEDSPV